MARSRLARLQTLIKDDLQQLPDLPVSVPKPEPKPEPAPKRTPDLFKLKISSYEENVAGYTVPTFGEPEAIKKTAVQSNVELQQQETIPTSQVNNDKRFVWLTNPKVTPEPGVRQNNRPLLDLKHGQVGPYEESYCPVLEVSKYCYRYIQRGEDSQRVATKIFDAGKFWARDWDLFSIHHPDADVKIVLVTESQFQDLVDDVNAAFHHLDLKIDSWQREHGLVTRFPRHPDTHPRYLGRSCSKEEYTQMMANAPGYGYRRSEEEKLPPPEERTLEAFKAKMDEIVQLQKTKGKIAKQKKIAQVILINRAMAQQLKRTQRYLGLRQMDVDVPFSGLQAELAGSKKPPSIDITAPSPYPFELSPIIICIDIECYERDDTKITEVGISTLDTLELNGIPPGLNGSNWRKHCRNRHIRIKEYSHLINGEFVDGCPANFEFGTSEFISLRDMPELLSKAFGPPYSKIMDVSSHGAFPALGSVPQASFNADEKRNVLILGHDPNQDIVHLQHLGFNPLTLQRATAKSPGFIEVLDTAALYRSYSRLQQSRKLGIILAEFDIEAWFLHNAGNDATYTMWVMMAIAVKDAVECEDEGVKKAKREETDKRIEQEVRELEESRRNAVEAFEDDSDGGLPVIPGALKDKMNEHGLTRAGEGLSLHDGNTPPIGPPGPREDSARGKDRGRGTPWGRVYGRRGRGYSDRDAP